VLIGAFGQGCGPISIEKNKCSTVIDRARLDESLALGIQFLLRHQRREGNFDYQYDWIKRYRNGEVGRDTPPWVEPGYAEAVRAGRESPELAESIPEGEPLSLPDTGEGTGAVEPDGSAADHDSQLLEEE